MSHTRVARLKNTDIKDPTVFLNIILRLASVLVHFNPWVGGWILVDGCGFEGWVRRNGK
jgi:hypothetical protein